MACTPTTGAVGVARGGPAVHACQIGGLRENDVGKGAASAADGSGCAAEGEGVEEVDGEDEDAGAKDEDEGEDAGADEDEDEDVNGRGAPEGKDVEEHAPPERSASGERVRVAT